MAIVQLPPPPVEHNVGTDNLCTELADQAGLPVSEVKELLDAGPNLDQARCILGAARILNTYPIDLWELHQTLTRQGNGS